MITEDYVSFEIAKLLKEKGFEGYSIITIYDEDAANAYVKELLEKHLPYSSDNPKLKEFFYTQPTLQLPARQPGTFRPRDCKHRSATPREPPRRHPPLTSLYRQGATGARLRPKIRCTERVCRSMRMVLEQSKVNACMC
jgi:hypothetical protein